MIYIISHDLQEPLRMIRNYLQLLEKKYSDKLDENARDYMKFAVDGSVRLKRMLDDLLLYSRISGYVPKYEVINLSQLIEKVKLNVEKKFKCKPITVLYEKNGNMKADRFLIEILFYQLIDNAVKFNDSNVLINIDTNYEADNTVYTFRDNGTGIKPEYHDKAFILFQKLHVNHDITGTGSGLAICRKIIEKHNGKIWIDRHYTQGAKIQFSIPKQNTVRFA